MVPSVAWARSNMCTRHGTNLTCAFTHHHFCVHACVRTDVRACMHASMMHAVSLCPDSYLRMNRIKELPCGMFDKLTKLRMLCVRLPCKCMQTCCMFERRRSLQGNAFDPPLNQTGCSDRESCRKLLGALPYTGLLTALTYTGAHQPVCVRAHSQQTLSNVQAYAHHSAQRHHLAQRHHSAQRSH